MMRPLLLAAGLGALAAAWLGPLPALAPHRFSAHMAMHLGVVAVAAPLIAAAVAGSALDPAGRWPALFVPVPAAILELAVVWGWHAPALHHAARHSTPGLVAEQASFLAAGLLVWCAACGGPPARRAERTLAGVMALLLTSAHMTLLGALLALAPRPLYAAGDAVALADQQAGGVLMLLVGGVAYLAGGLGLSARLLGATAAAAPGRRVATRRGDDARAAAGGHR
jgi:putative membrane protein